MAKNMKRIYTVTVKKLRDDGEPITPTPGVIWENYGIRADAEILIPSNPQGDSVVQHITSGGLWGIEDGCDCRARSWYGEDHDTACHTPAYIAEIEKEQLEELGEQLHAIGFSKRAISAAFKAVKREAR